MAASWLTVVLKLTDRDSTYVNQVLHSRTLGTSSRGEKRRIVQGIYDLLKGALGGVHGANLWVGVADDAGAKPAGAIACTQVNATGDTVTFTYGGVAITFTEGSSNTLLGFARGASNTTLALALATVINAHPILGGLVTASPSVGTITLTAKIPTQLVQDMAITTNDATAFGLTQLTGGTEGAAALQLQNIHLGRTA